MVRFSRFVLAGIMAGGIALFAAIGSNDAQEKKPSEKHDSASLYHSLRDVINTGAKMFNEQGDHAGCYRLYHGSLLAVRPFLAPDVQKSIDKGLANAEKLSSFSDRAFELRRVLDDIRDKSKPAEGKKVEEKKKEEKKVEEKKKEEKKVEEKKVPDKKIEEKKVPDKKVEEKKSAASTGKLGQLAGKVSFAGKSLAGGYFVTLVGDSNKKFSSAIQKDGSFQFKTPIPTGNYRVAVEPVPGDATKGVNVPARYRNEGTSGLSVQVDAGNNSVNLEIVN